MNDMLESLAEIIKEEVPGVITVLRLSSGVEGVAVEMDGVWLGTAFFEGDEVRYNGYKFLYQFAYKLVDPECFTRLGEAIRQSIPDMRWSKTSQRLT